VRNSVAAVVDGGAAVLERGGGRWLAPGVA